MPIRVKIAETAQELHDVYQLRHQVYVEGEGYFKDMPSTLIVDQFDAIPNSGNVVAYHDNTAIIQE